MYVLGPANWQGRLPLTIGINSGTADGAILRIPADFLLPTFLTACLHAEVSIRYTPDSPIDSSTVLAVLGGAADAQRSIWLFLRERDETDRSFGRLGRIDQLADGRQNVGDRDVVGGELALHAPFQLS